MFTTNASLRILFSQDSAFYSSQKVNKIFVLILMWILEKSNLS